jgi:hypothetical protein
MVLVLARPTATHGLKVIGDIRRPRSIRHSGLKADFQPKTTFPLVLTLFKPHRKLNPIQEMTHD